MSTINTYSDIDRRDSLQKKFEEIDGTIYVYETELSAANVIGMNASPIELLAGVAGYTYEVVGATLILDYGTAAFTGGGTVQIQNADGDPVLDVAAAAAITSASDKVTIFTTSATAPYQQDEGLAVQITNNTAPFATGDGVVRLKIAYRKHATGL